MYILHLLFALCVAIPITGNAATYKSVHTIRHGESWQSTSYTISSNDHSMEGTVIYARRNDNDDECTYDLYDSWHNREGYGRVFVAALGSYYAWEAEIEVYDHSGRLIGRIEGETSSPASSNFSMWDRNNKKVAVAHYDKSMPGFFITDPNKGNAVIGQFVRVNPRSNSSHWEYQVINYGNIDERVLKTFAGFVIDKQVFFDYKS